jgi:1,4-alpha-glucan branching enzyme
VGQVGATSPRVIISKSDLTALIQARHASPHAVLGMHPHPRGRTPGLVVRALVSGAAGCEVVEAVAHPSEAWPMTRLAPEGLFEVFIPKRSEVFKYQLRIFYPGGEVRQIFDPYCFLPTLGDQDLYLFNEGNEHRIYEKLGSHVRQLGGVSGV